MDDEMRKEVLGEVRADELKVIREYVQDIPPIKKQLNEVSETVERIDSRLEVVEIVVREHETEIKKLKHKIA